MTFTPGHLSRIWAALLLLVAACTWLPASAQGQASSTLEAQRNIIRSYARQADDLEKRMRANTQNDAQLVVVRIALEGLAGQLLDSSANLSPRIAEINARLDQIGPAPAEGQPAEPKTLADERASLLQERAEINALLGGGGGVGSRIGSLIETVAQLRRDLFSGQFYKRYDISSALSAQVLADFSAEASRVYSRFASWLGFALRFKLSSVLLAAFFALLAAALLLIGGRRAFGRMLTVDRSQAEPSYLSRLSVAFWSTFLPSLALAVFLLATYFFLGYFNVLRPDIAEILTTLFNVIATVYFINRLARAVFSPGLPNWRVVAIDTGAAWKLSLLVWATSIVTGADFVLNRIYQVLGSPLSLTIAKSLIATVIVGTLIVLIGAVKPFRDAGGKPKPWPAYLRYPLLALGSATIIAALLGYIGLARFMSQQVVVTGAILATMYLGHLSAQALSRIGAFRETGMGRRLGSRFKIDDATADQLGLVLSIVIHALVIAVGIPLIFLQWGFQWGDILTWTLNVANEIRVGSVSFSLVGILIGLVVFLIGYVVTRWFQSWLDDSVMTRGRVDAGVRNSIRTVVGYAGIAVAVLIGLSAAGISLSSLALIAGGLSLGIGFGLQNIVQNFVSGLILLAERPFKVGDWIVAGGVSGTVKKISVRATQIETFQRQMVILPNSELINAAVGNWTHRNRLARTEIRVTAAYGTDAQRMQGLLMDVARAHPKVLRNPEPFVALTNIADMGLEFELRVFVADVYESGAVQNELRFAILDMVEREGIVLAYAPRAFHPKEPAEDQKPSQAEDRGEVSPAAEGGAKPRAAAKRRKRQPRR